MMIRSVRLTKTTEKNVEKGSLDDHYLCTDIDRMEKIALQVPLSETKRPGWDVKVLEALGAAQIQVNEDIWQQGVERRREAELWIYTYVYGGGCKIEKDIISDIQKLVRI